MHFLSSSATMSWFSVTCKHTAGQVSLCSHECCLRSLNLSTPTPAPLTGPSDMPVIFLPLCLCSCCSLCLDAEGTLIIPKCCWSFNVLAPMDLGGTAQGKEMDFGAREVWFHPCFPLTWPVTFDLLYNCSKSSFIHPAHANSSTNYTELLSVSNTIIHETGQGHSGCLIIAG